jgi:TPR repeat protein
VDRDYGEAMTWYRKAADAGNATAMYNIGVLYENGFGVQMDSDKAVEWYKKAAAGNSEDAKAALKSLAAKN